jgi:hypothetical protein
VGRVILIVLALGSPRQCCGSSSHSAAETRQVRWPAFGDVQPESAGDDSECT